MTRTVLELDRAGPGDVAPAIQNAGISGAGGGSERPGEPAGAGTPGDGSSVGAVSVGADAAPEETAAIVAAITDHLRAEARAAEAHDAEPTEGGLWTVSVRMDRPPRTSDTAADVPTDPWVAAGRMP